MESGKGFFWGTSFQLFWGSGRPFSEATSLFQIGGSAFPERWLKPPNANANIINAQPIRNAVQHFSREVVPVPAEPPPWKSGQPGTPYEKKTTLSGGKTKKKLPNVFLRLCDTHKKYILQKILVKTAIRALSSGQSNLQTPIWGCHRQLDDQHRGPNTNNKDHLVGQLAI